MAEVERRKFTAEEGVSLSASMHSNGCTDSQDHLTLLNGLFTPAPEFEGVLTLQHTTLLYATGRKTRAGVETIDSTSRLLVGPSPFESSSRSISSASRFLSSVVKATQYDYANAWSRGTSRSVTTRFEMSLT